MNVGCRIFETQQRTLHRYPHTLLGNPDRRIVYFDPVKHYYYFGRHRDSFESILYFYQSGGQVICPMDIHPDEFYNELEFFDLPSDVLRNFELEEGIDTESDLETGKLPTNLFQRKLWLLLEYPTSSVEATIVSIISVYVILLSVLTFCLETEPSFQAKSQDSDTNQHDPFAFIESICILWFCTEFLLRFLTCPEKVKFFSSGMNIVDLIAIIPYVANLFTKLIYDDSYSTKENYTLTLLRTIRLVRVFRIFKLSRHVKGLKVLGWTLKACFNELGLLVFFLLIGVILFSSAVYFAEEGEGTDFESIAFFWAVTTMTTVGYGDLVPKQIGGKIVGSLCAIAGVLTLALPLPVMVSNFNYFYQLEVTRNRSIKERLEPYQHTTMCPFLPNPELIRSFQRDKLKSSNLSRGDSENFDSDNSSFQNLKFEPNP